MKKYKVAIIILGILWVCVLIVAFLPVRFPLQLEGYSSSRILVSHHATTGPDAHVIKGVDALYEAAGIAPEEQPQWERNWIWVDNIGEVRSWAEYPANVYHDYILEGYIVGVESDGAITFHADKFTPVGTISDWISYFIEEHLNFGTIFLLFPIYVLVYVALPIATVFVVVQVVRKRKKPIAQ